MFMLSQTPETAEAVKTVMQNVYSQTDIDFNIYVSRIHREGVSFV